MKNHQEVYTLCENTAEQTDYTELYSEQ